MEVDDALAGFCTREHPRLVGALSLYCGDARLAEELAQEALLRAVDAWPRVRQMAAPGAWVHRVGMNLVHSWFRRRAAEARATARLGAGDGRHDDPDVADVQVVRSAVAGLPRRQRQAVVLRHYLGYGLDETAAALSVTPQAAAALTYRAMSTLRRRLDPLGDHEEVGQ
jgi:RNA polymerase sigma factor (sigma-70 family)